MPHSSAGSPAPHDPLYTPRYAIVAMRAPQPSAPHLREIALLPLRPDQRPGEAAETVRLALDAGAPPAGGRLVAGCMDSFLRALGANVLAQYAQPEIRVSLDAALRALGRIPTDNAEIDFAPVAERALARLDGRASAGTGSAVRLADLARRHAIPEHALAGIETDASRAAAILAQLFRDFLLPEHSRETAGAESGAESGATGTEAPGGTGLSGAARTGFFGAETVAEASDAAIRAFLARAGLLDGAPRAAPPIPETAAPPPGWRANPWSGPELQYCAWLFAGGRDLESLALQLLRSPQDIHDRLAGLGLIAAA